jgi:general secretion pathway protein G
MKRMRTLTRNNTRQGFTLTEVLLVLAIIGVIAAMVVPNLIGTQKRANIDATKANITAFENAVKNFAIANGGEFPQGSREEVIAMMLNPGVDSSGRPVQPYLESRPKDAWQQDLFYEFPSSKVPSGTKPAIWSSGPNKQNEDGGGDDINNWTAR